jgi:hypothetical protein
MSPFKGGQSVETLDFTISHPSKSFSSSKCSKLVKRKYIFWAQTCQHMHLQANVIKEYVQDQILPDVVNFCFIRKVPTKV